MARDEAGRAFTPGDVALVRNEYGVWNRAIYAVRPGGMAWAFGVTNAEAPDYAESRPLVVIDPENREEVERLVVALMDVNFWSVIPVDVEGIAHRSNQMQAALREFANPEPPKPEEPTGLGAVVRDGKGVAWVRADEDAHPWHPIGDDYGAWASWGALNAVEVLSEGVQP